MSYAQKFCHVTSSPTLLSVLNPGIKPFFFSRYALLFQLSDKLVPMDRAFLKKEMKIVGWSSNLLKNASGEVRLYNNTTYQFCRYKTLTINNIFPSLVARNIGLLFMWIKRLQ